MAVEEVRCDHCNKVMQVDPAGTTQIEVRFIGAKHRVSFQAPTGSGIVPKVVDDGGITDLEQ